MAEEVRVSSGPASEAIRAIAEAQKAAMVPATRIAEQFKSVTWTLGDRRESLGVAAHIEQVRAANERERRAHLETADAVKELAASSRVQSRNQWAMTIAGAILGAVFGALATAVVGGMLSRHPKGWEVREASGPAFFAPEAQCVPSHARSGGLAPRR